MTSKDYDLIVAAIRRARDQAELAERLLGPSYGVKKTRETFNADYGISSVIGQLVGVLLEDNPFFDYEGFHKAIDKVEA